MKYFLLPGVGTVDGGPTGGKVEKISKTYTAYYLLHVI